MLRLDNIRKSYRIGPTEVDILKGVSLDVPDGEMVSITGPSGCGKSTFMNIIGLLDRPTSGSYAINGVEVGYEDDDRLSNIRNRSIGFVFQQYHLLAKLTALENVLVPLVYRPDAPPPAEARERGLEMLRLVGMGERGNHRPSELSGGQQQRVAIARALVGKPALMLADEPTGALDTKVGQEIMDLFRLLNAQEGITMVIITHDPRIARQCTRVAEMREGRVLE